MFFSDNIHKGDGSLDIKRISQLPIEEYMDVVGDLTEEQYEEYLLPIFIIYISNFYNNIKMTIYDFNAYNFSEYQIDVTIPEEVRDKVSDWEKETRKWRADVESLIKSQHTETRETVNNEANRTISQVNVNTNQAKTDVINTVNQRASEIKTKEDTSYSVILNIWNKVKDMF